MNTSNPALAFLEAAIVVVPLNGNDNYPPAQRSHLLLRPSLTPTSPLLDLVGAAGSLPTNSLPNELFPLSLESVAPTLFFSLALPPKPTPTSSSPPTASPNQQQQQDEEEEPTTTRDGVIASSLVGAIVAVGLVGVVWCLVRAKLQRKSKFRREKEEERKDGGSELGETGWEEKGGEAEVLEGLEKHREENERDGMEVRLGFVSHSSPSIFSAPLLPPALPSAAQPTLSHHTPLATAHSATSPPRTAQSQSDAGNERNRTTTASTGFTIDSYYTSPVISPAFGTERCDGRGGRSPALSNSDMGVAL
ncbi:hypothetical protein BDY24DRAFT_418317 [Mrakia frigida]|uniref:uncharacterized protein n=1 Tax=Mrakia frigida TaxID=29902 RepID=UPI003FCBEE5D